MKHLVMVMALALLVAACSPETGGEVRKSGDLEAPQEVMEAEPSWKNSALVDVRTGETFTIDEFEAPVLIESFAVWCPTCLKQQREMAKLEEGVHVALDTDPNEDEAKVKEHVAKHGFDWYFAVAPAEVTQSLVDEFGVGVVNAPASPVILVCEDGSRLLGRGVKTAAELKEEIAMGC